MEKFTLDAAQMGKPLTTRDGKPARYVAILTRQQPAPLVVEVLSNWHEIVAHGWKSAFEGFEDRTESPAPIWELRNYCEDGSYLGFVEDAEDLFISELDPDHPGPISKDPNQTSLF